MWATFILHSVKKLLLPPNQNILIFKDLILGLPSLRTWKCSIQV